MLIAAVAVVFTVTVAVHAARGWVTLEIGVSNVTIATGELTRGERSGNPIHASRIFMSGRCASRGGGSGGGRRSKGRVGGGRTQGHGATRVRTRGACIRAIVATAVGSVLGMGHRGGDGAASRCRVCVVAAVAATVVVGVAAAAAATAARAAFLVLVALPISWLGGVKR